MNDPFIRRQLRYMLLLAVLLPGTAAAQDADTEGKALPQKPAWKWSIEERLAARFDPVAMAAREAEFEAEQETLRKRWDLLAEEWAKMTGPPPATENIDGSKTPELFLPVELFGMLLNRGLPQEEWVGLQESRGRIEQRAAALGFGRDLWDRLDKVAAPYLKPLYSEDRRRRLARASDQKQKEDTIRLCRLRAQAMETAKAEFGEEAFLRLLYEAVAPDNQPTYILEGWPPDYHRHAEILRSWERGCR